jgi:hypothetical protein
MNLSEFASRVRNAKPGSTITATLMEGDDLKVFELYAVWVHPECFGHEIQIMLVPIRKTSTIAHGPKGEADAQEPQCALTTQEQRSDP